VAMEGNSNMTKLELPRSPNRLSLIVHIQVGHLSIYAGIRSVSQEYYIDINRKVHSMWLELVEEA
jgi:hypothetical protein